MTGSEDVLRDYGHCHVAVSSTEDARELARNIRASDRAEIYYYNGADPEEELLASLDCAKISLSLKGQDKTLIAMFGVGWTANPRIGRSWLLSTELLYEPRIAIQFLRRCASYLEYFMVGHDVLFNHVHDGNLASIRWLKWLGFEATAQLHDHGWEKQPFTEYCRFSGEAVRRLYLARDWQAFLNARQRA